MPTDSVATAVARYRKCLKALRASVALPLRGPRDRSGVIHDFELAYHWGWVALRAALEQAGPGSSSALDAILTAKRIGWLQGHHPWDALVAAAVRCDQPYDTEFEESVIERIIGSYVPALGNLGATLEARCDLSDPAHSPKVRTGRST